MGAVTEPFDLESLYQAADLPLPPDPVQAQVLWAANAADLAAAADEIKRLRGLLDERAGHVRSLLDYIGVDPSDEPERLEAFNAPYCVVSAVRSLAPAEGRVAG